MARLIALFDSYDAAHGAAQALVAAGLPAMVTYLMRKGDQGGDGMEGFYPGVTPAQRAPDGAEPGAGVDAGAGEDPPADDAPPAEEAPRAEVAAFRGLTTHRFAVTGTDSLTISPSLPERLRDLGLANGDIHLLLDRLGEGRVAAVIRLEGPGERPMEILADRGATEVQQVF